MRTSKNVMKATGVSVLILGATVLATTDSRGDGTATLSAEQKAAKVAFEDDMSRSLRELKSDCQVDLSVTADFENYNKSAWSEVDPGWACGGVLAGVRSGCVKAKEEAWRSVPRDADGRPLPTPPTPRTEVRTIACLFTGHQAKRAGEDFGSRRAA